MDVNTNVKYFIYANLLADSRTFPSINGLRFRLVEQKTRLEYLMTSGNLAYLKIKSPFHIFLSDTKDHIEP